jgi:ribose transport system substrate-binding protein
MLGHSRTGLYRAVVVLAIAVVTAFVAVGCSAKSDDSDSDGQTSTPAAGIGDAAELKVPSLDGKTIGVAGLSTQNYFGRESYRGAIARVKELGGTPIAVNAEQDAQKQVANLENLISQKPDAIISHGTDPKIIDPVYKRVREAGIPLFTIDTPSPYSISNSQADNYTAGAQIARALAEGIHGKGNVLVFNAFSNSLRVLGIRYNQLKEVLTDYPDIKMLDPQLEDVVQNTVEDARKKTQDALQKYPKGEIAAIIGFWDQPMIGAAQAVDAAGRDEIKVYGIDGDPTVLKLISGDSSFDADAALKPRAIGETAVDNAARYLAGQKDLPKTTYVDPILVTKDNVAVAERALFGRSAGS